MKKLALSLALVFAAGVAYAQQAETKAPEAAKSAEKSTAVKKNYHPVEAEVVSTDVDKLTIKFKAGDAEKTAPVSMLAKGRLAKLKAGDKVILSCKDVDGEHKEVVAIRPAKPAAEAK